MQSAMNWISDVKDALDTILPDRWDCNIPEVFVTNSSGMAIFYILYPEITITNTRRESHTIYDLYLRLKFNPNGSLYSVDATRGRLSPEERASKYPHSHISSCAAEGSWGGFCFGSGPIGSDVAELKRVFDKFRFEAFLHSFQIYIEWESIEGGPYQSMRNIAVKQSTPRISNATLEDYYIKFINKFEFQDFIIQEGIVKINHEDRKFIESVSSIIRSTDFVYKDSSTGNYYVDRTISSSSISRPLNFNFKGNAIYQVVDPTLSVSYEREKYPNPAITEYIARKLSRELTLYAYTESRRIARLTKGILIGGVALQDM